MKSESVSAVGYGGSCFPKDVSALDKIAESENYDFQILKSVIDVNKFQKSILSEKIIRYFEGDISGKTIAVWGLSFKPDTDDIREAPSITIINHLLDKGAKVRAFDPEAMENINKYALGDKIEYASNQYEAIHNSDALAIITEWAVFRTPDFQKVSEALNEKVIFDGRNLYDLAQMKELGYYYESIGRPIIHTSGSS